MTEVLVDECDVADCTSPRYASTTLYCNKHRIRFRKHGDPNVVLPRRQPGPRPESWVEIPTYRTLHNRLESVRGKARSHVCLCGQPADEWAYDGLDPDELIGQGHSGWKANKPFSLDLDRYQALCRSCHRRSER